MNCPKCIGTLDDDGFCLLCCYKLPADHPTLPFEPRKLARNTDPDTSHAAAEDSGKTRARHHRVIMDAFHKRPEEKMTSEEVSERVYLTHDQVWRRMNELCDAGSVVKLDEKHRNRSGSMARCYVLSPKTGEENGR